VLYQDGLILNNLYTLDDLNAKCLMIINKMKFRITNGLLRYIRIIRNTYTFVNSIKLKIGLNKLFTFSCLKTT